jgi:uncharacterized protein YbjT (DUF2867 family)
MKVFVTGVSGQLGQDAVNELVNIAKAVEGYRCQDGLSRYGLCL